MKKLNVTFDYDREADVLHISLGTGEPSYCEEVDDLILVERGFFSKEITGFQVLDVKYHGIKQVRIEQIVKRELGREKQEQRKYFQNKSEVIPDVISARLSKNVRLKNLMDCVEA